MHSVENELEDVIEDIYSVYLDGRDLDKDRSVDTDDFASFAKEQIEEIHGPDRFDGFNLKSYAKAHAIGSDDSWVENYFTDEGDE